MTSIRALETDVINRYDPRWRGWASHYDYKHLKGARLLDILQRTGGLPPLAVELGVGPGGVAAAVSARGIPVVGLDLSADALASARLHCPERLHLLRGSGFALPFREGSIPLLYASQVLHLFDPAGRLALMGEVARVLQPGGRFVFDMKNVLSHLLSLGRYSAQRRRTAFPSTSEILALLRQAGFSSVSRWPGLLPRLQRTSLPNLAPLRLLAHTTFFVATRPPAAPDAHGG